MESSPKIIFMLQFNTCLLASTVTGSRPVAPNANKRTTTVTNILSIFITQVATQLFY